MVDFNFNTTFDITTDAAFATSTTVLNDDSRAIGGNIADRNFKNVLGQSRSSPPTTIWMRGVTTVSGNRITLDWAFFVTLSASFWNGGTAEIWRVSSGVLSRVRTSEIVASTATYIDLEADGGAAPAVGDMVVATRVGLNPAAANVNDRVLGSDTVGLVQFAPYEGQFASETRWYGDDADDPAVWIDDATDGVFARYSPTTVGVANGRRVRFLWTGNGATQTFYPAYEVGKTYVCEFEMRTDVARAVSIDNTEMPTHEITSLNGVTVSETFPVSVDLTTAFQTFSIEYEVTAAYAGVAVNRLGPVLTAVGQYDLRAFRVYEKGAAFGALTTEETARYSASNIDHIRDHNIVKTDRPGKAYNFERLVKDFIHSTLGNTVALGIPKFWLQPEWYTYDDADMLVDYLSGTAGTTGADLRIALGRTAPWTDDLHIIFEISNETWNTATGFYNFPAMTDSVTAASYDAADIYGKFNQLYIDKMKTSAAFNAADFTFFIGGFTKSNYGAAAAEHSSDVTLVGTAPYVGGWEVGATGATETPAGYIEALFWTPTVNASDLDARATGLATAISNGANAALKGATYEDALSFSDVPPNIPAEEVRLSKSVAGATAWVDKMAEQFSRYSTQSYFTIGQGGDWASHNPTNGKTYPHHQWVEVWNANCVGSMHQTLNRKPLLKSLTVNTDAYADVSEIGFRPIKTATGWSVLVVNRNIPYDAIDSGDALYDVADSGARSVQIDVPQGSYTVVKHTMSGAFNDQNFDSAEATYNANIAVSQTSLGASNGRIAETIPASKAVIFVFTKVLSALVTSEGTPIVTSEGTNVVTTGA